MRDLSARPPASPQAIGQGPPSPGPFLAPSKDGEHWVWPPGESTALTGPSRGHPRQLVPEAKFPGSNLDTESPSQSPPESLVTTPNA